MLLEDLAAHFKMKTQDTIDRVTKLSSEGLLTGSTLVDSNVELEKLGGRFLNQSSFSSMAWLVFLFSTFWKCFE